MLDFDGSRSRCNRERNVGSCALFKFVERGLATRSAATVTSVTPGVAMLCHQRVDDAWRALWPLNVTHARAAFTNAVEVKGGPRRSRLPTDKKRAENAAKSARNSYFK